VRRAQARLKFALATVIGNVTNFTFFFSHKGNFWAILWSFSLILQNTDPLSEKLENTEKYHIHEMYHHTKTGADPKIVKATLAFYTSNLDPGLYTS
jgi:hypothetical protein